MKKILLISNRMMHYRVSVYNYFADRFRQDGWELIVRSDELQRNNPHVPRFDHRLLPFRFQEYASEIRAIGPDVVIVFLHLKDKIIWPLVHWLKFKGLPVAFWTKGANLDRPDDKISRLLYAYMHTVSDRLILYSAHEMSYVAERNRHKVTVANNTVNFGDYPCVPDSREAIKKEFGIPFKKVVLCVGRLGAAGGRKKADHLIRIFREIDDPALGLVLVGSGLDESISRSINTANTLYLGEVFDASNTQISKIFKMADVFSIPGHVGLGLNQAFYWGLPVVTEEGGQPPEINYLVSGRNGYIVPENDIVALKEKILLLLRDDDLRAAMGRNAREDILKNASVEGMYQGFKECVDSLVCGAAPGVTGSGRGQR